MGANNKREQFDIINDMYIQSQDYNQPILVEDATAAIMGKNQSALEPVTGSTDAITKAVNSHYAQNEKGVYSDDPLINRNYEKMMSFGADYPKNSIRAKNEFNKWERAYGVKQRRAARAVKAEEKAALKAKKKPVKTKYNKPGERVLAPITVKGKTYEADPVIPVNLPVEEKSPVVLEEVESIEPQDNTPVVLPGADDTYRPEDEPGYNNPVNMFGRAVDKVSNYFGVDPGQGEIDTRTGKEFLDEEQVAQPDPVDTLKGAHDNSNAFHYPVDPTPSTQIMDKDYVPPTDKWKKADKKALGKGVKTLGLNDIFDLKNVEVTQDLINEIPRELLSKLRGGYKRDHSGELVPLNNPVFLDRRGNPVVNNGHLVYQGAVDGMAAQSEDGSGYMAPREEEGYTKQEQKEVDKEAMKLFPKGSKLLEDGRVLLPDGQVLRRKG